MSTEDARMGAIVALVVMVVGAGTCAALGIRELLRWICSMIG